jgi:NAD(P)-dependent dehydrogenase (short-subunit alcohol dehydrogenase family)
LPPITAKAASRPHVKGGEAICKTPIIAVITGGNSGIGLATAKRFVEEGAYVFITGRRQEELDKAVEAIGSGVTAVQGDVANLDDLDRLFAIVRAEKGHVDVLFANAGLARSLRSAGSPRRNLSWSSASMSKEPCSRSKRDSR